MSEPGSALGNASTQGRVHSPPGAPPTAPLDLGDHQVKLVAPTPGGDDEFGLALAAAGDVDGDGLADVLVGAEQDDDAAANAGAAFVFFGDASGVQGTRTITLLADDAVALDALGAAVAGAGDLDGDGYADLAVGAPGQDAGGAQSGAVYLWMGSADGPVAAAKLTPGDAGSLAGSALAGMAVVSDQVGGLLDVDGDGLADLLVGGPSQDGVGAVWVYGGMTSASDLSLTSTLGAADADTADAFGTAVGGGDLNGDGYADVVVGAPDDDGVAANAGAVYLFPGGSGGPTTAAQAKLTAADGVAADAFGRSLTLPGDLDGDGLGDLAVGAYLVDGVASNQGALYVYAGSTGALESGALDGSAGVKVDAPDPLESAFFGISLSGLGDLDGDGRMDLLVGASGASGGGVSGGAAYIFLGSDSLIGDAAADKLLAQEAGGGFRYGRSTAGLGDVNGNGVADFAVGAPAYAHALDDTGGGVGDATGGAWLHLPACYDIDQDGACRNEDCDDLDADTFAGAAELDSTTACMRDADADGYGDVGADGLIQAGTDCDDADAAVHPTAAERCNDVDDDCDGTVDVDAEDTLLWAPDVDGDQWTDNTATQSQCQAPAGMLSPTFLTDCDDTDPSVHPGAVEVAKDGIDQDCSGADLALVPQPKSCATSAGTSSAFWWLALVALGWRRRARR